MQLLNFPAINIIYIYIYIAVSILVFDLLYILSGKMRYGIRRYYKNKWKRRLKKIFTIGPLTRVEEKKHRRKLKKLEKITKLMAYTDALQELKKEGFSKEIEQYLEMENEAFQRIAASYARRENMERAYFAWFLKKYHIIHADQLEFAQILIKYLDHSTIFCRENVFKAIYGSGNPRAVEMVFQYLNDHGLYHSEKLLSDGLLAYPGNTDELAHLLWNHERDWNGTILCAIIQFISRKQTAGDFPSIFLEAMKDRKQDLEVRLALVRYFGHVVYEPAKETLLRFAQEKEQLELAIVSAATLQFYPGPDTFEVLQKAVKSANWYIRSNAAESLLSMTRSEDQKKLIDSQTDVYARDILNYKLHKRAG